VEKLLQDIRSGGIALVIAFVLTVASPVVACYVFEQQSEIGGSDTGVGVEPERFQHAPGSFTGVGDVVVGRLDFDFDELAEAGDVVERDRVAVENESLAFFLDSGGRFEAEAVEDALGGDRVVDGRLVFLAGLRGVVDERSLVRQRDAFVAVGCFAADTECLVGLREVAVGRVVVGVDLRDGAFRRRVESVQVRADDVVVRPDLDLDLVHTLKANRHDKNRPTRIRNEFAVAGFSAGMNAEAIDHVNLRVPESGVEEFVAFYRDHMGFDLEHYDAYQSGDRGFFYVRLGESCIVHVSPRESVPEPTGENFNHFAVLVDEPLSDVKARLDDAAVEIETEAVREGAVGELPCVYVTDPAGYTVEFKSRSAE
jgi:catechol 2,3-dioxygenase-like lactoylglutathione lyase family enzyme